MKTAFLSKMVLTATVMFGLRVDKVGADEKGPYLTMDVGYARSSDVTIEEYGSNNPMLDLKLDPAPRFSLGAGYRPCRWLGFGLETSVLDTDWELSDNSETGSLLQVPIMFNVEFRLPNKTLFKPYAGVSAGGGYERIEFDRITDGDNADADWAFVWQAYGGMRFQVSEKFSLGVVYKYLQTGNTTWNAIDLGTSSDFRLGTMRSHSISATALFEF